MKLAVGEPWLVWDARIIQRWRFRFVYSFLGYDTVQTGGCVRTFRRKILPVSSGVIGSVRSYSNDGCTTFSRKFGTDVPDSTVYTLLPAVQNSDYFYLCNVGVMVLFIFLANVQRARLEIQIYMFITVNVSYFIRYWG